jgi:hypothetical protein
VDIENLADIKSPAEVRSLADIKNRADIESLVEVGSPVDIGCCSASLRVLVLGYILMLGLKLQPNLIAS